MRERSNEELIQELKQDGVLRSPRIEGALRVAPREFFVPSVLRERAYEDEALPIGYGQTISQPHTVVFMLELLAADEGDAVLEAGSGSGWQTALLAHMVGAAGRVHAFEIVPELCAWGAENIARFPILDARVTRYCRSATPGLPELSGRIDRVIAAAEADPAPAAWREQLKVGGMLVYPSGHSVWREKKTGPEKFQLEEFPGFAFVPYR